MLMKLSCRRDTRLNFFSERVLNRWNSLPGKGCCIDLTKHVQEKIESAQTEEDGLLLWAMVSLASRLFHLYIIHM